jgi:hypothetical protein
MKIFDDQGEHLDRFRLVLGLSVLSVTILALIDLNNTQANIRSEIALLVVTFIVGVTLTVVMRTSGVARRPRRIVGIVVWATIGGLVVLLVIGWASASGDGVVTFRPSVVWALIAILAPVLVLRRVMMQQVVTGSTLLGAIAVYFLLAIAFDYAFLAIQDVSGTDFFGQHEPTTSFMYFSLVSLTTVGYGDLAAVGSVGRFLASMEAVVGQILLVTVVARLVSLYTRPRFDTEPETSGSSNEP